MPEREAQVNVGAVAGEGEPVRSEARRLAAWNIIERKGLERPAWSRVGTAFVNRDGSINVFLESIPLQGKIQLRDDRDPNREATPPWMRKGGGSSGQRSTQAQE